MSAQYTKYVASRLMKSGFTNIKLLPPDEDFGADIIATSKNGVKVCIKCVHGPDVLSGETVETVYAAKKYYDCKGAMIVTSGVFTDKAEKTAENLRIVLKQNIISPEMRSEEHVPRETSAQRRKTCKYCKSQIDANSLLCPICRKDLRSPFKRGKGWILYAVFYSVVVGAVILGVWWHIGNKNSTEYVNSGSKTNEIELSDISKDVIIKEVDIDEYTATTIGALNMYGQYIEGVKVMAVAGVSYTIDDTIYYIYKNTYGEEITCTFHFDSENDLKNVERSQRLAIAGTLKHSFTAEVNLEGCSIVGIGELPEGAEIDSAAVNEYEEKYKEEQARLLAEREAKAAQDKIDYIANCKEPVYTDIARNPGNYKGEKFKVSGTVIQVIETETTYLGPVSVVLRVDTGNDNIWYITYSRDQDESRILENDWITCYGECEGVESYTTVLGAQVTIPSMKMRFYE